MPVYEYECAACEVAFEMPRKFSDPPLTVCPDCGGPVEKLISKSSFALKGSGWYQSDYGNKAKPAPSCGQAGSKPACAGCPSGAD